MSSILFIVCSILFIGLFATLIKSRIENIIEALVIGSAYLFVTVGIIGAIYEVLHIPVYLVTLCLGIGVVDIVLAIILAKRKQFNIKYKTGKKEDKYLLSVIILTGFVLFMCLYHFGFNLKLTYEDVDAVRYFQEAMNIIKTRTVSGEFVTPLWISIFVQLIMPIQSDVFLFRGMIIGNICMQILIANLFFVLANKVNRHRNAINIIITLLFWCGYQLYILSYGTFLHWQDGIFLLMFIIYHIILIWEKKDNLKYGIISCIAGTLGLALCYPFLGIIFIPLVLPEIVVWIKKERKKKKISICEKIVFSIAVIAGITLGIIFMKERIPNLEDLLYNFSSEGLAYKEPYMDFLFLIPVVILFFYLMMKKQYLNNTPRTIFRMIIMAVIFIICWYSLYEKGYLSNYYLYRNYYVLWLLAWLATAQTIGLLLQEKQTLLVTMYAVVYGLAILISVSGLDRKIYNHNPDLYLDNPSGRTMAPLYCFNLSNWSVHRENIIDANMFNIYQYRIEKMKDDNVAVISSKWKVMEVQWYQAICGMTAENPEIDIEQSSLARVLDWLEEFQFNYVLINKIDPTLQSYVESMNKFWDIEVETDEATIYKKPSEGWKNILQSYTKASNDSIDLETYIRKNYGYNNVLLLCEGTYDGNGDVNEYSAYVGGETLKYVGQFDIENFVQSTYIFNNDHVKYLAIYKDSELYLYNEKYFKSQKTLYENDLAMIITYDGEGWMPNQ